MAKKTISRLSVLAVLIVFLAACSKTSEYTNVIPADASVVASINLKSLASKAGLDDKENEAAKQKVLEALKSGMNAATFQQLEKVMKNPGESGINVESPFYVFSSSSFPWFIPIYQYSALRKRPSLVNFRLKSVLSSTS